MLKPATFVLTLALSTTSALAAEVKVSESQGVNLTIYNQNFGLVKDIRSLELSDGINHVRFEDVAAQIDPTTVSYQSLTAPNAVVVREQNYQYDLLDPNTILGKSIGKQVKFKQFLSNGSTEEIEGTLLNSPIATVSDTDGNTSTRSQGLVVKTGDGIVMNPAGQIQLAELPAGLVSKPSLLWKLEATKAGTHRSEIAYQTKGMNWRCDYVVVVNKDDTAADLTSWVTLDNKSGASFKNASLKLIAGDVHKVETVQNYRSKAMSGGFAMPASVAPQFSEQSFAEYHLYSLSGKTNVNDNETKQMSLFSSANVPTKKQFVYEPERSQWYQRADSKKVQVKFEIANTEKNQLGMPMPKGKVRVYKRDADGALQFIGEDEIDHTPRDEKVRVYIGDAFDIVAERKQTSMRQDSDRVQRASYEIELRNHKKDKVTVTCVEHSYGDWTILNSSLPYTKKDSRTFEFAVEVPADGKTTLTYEIQTRY